MTSISDAPRAYGLGLRGRPPAPREREPEWPRPVSLAGLGLQTPPPMPDRRIPAGDHHGTVVLAGSGRALAH